MEMWRAMNVAIEDRVRVGIIGAGFIGHLHAEAFTHVPNAEVVAIASPSPERGHALADQFGIPSTSPTIERCSSATT
jgi:predicted dehydrogenase